MIESDDEGAMPMRFTENSFGKGLASPVEKWYLILSSGWQPSQIPLCITADFSRSFVNQLVWVIKQGQKAAKAIPRLTFQVDEFRKGTGRRFSTSAGGFPVYLTP